MLDPLVTSLIFIAVIAITAVLFGGWLIVAVVTLIGRLLMAPFRGKSDPALAMATGTVASATSVRCPNDRCRAENPAGAAFCRRCGAPLRAAVQPVQARRVAMW